MLFCKIQFRFLAELDTLTSEPQYHSFSLANILNKWLFSITQRKKRTTACQVSCSNGALMGTDTRRKFSSFLGTDTLEQMLEQWSKGSNCMPTFINGGANIQSFHLIFHSDKNLTFNRINCVNPS